MILGKLLKILRLVFLSYKIGYLLTSFDSFCFFFCTGSQLWLAGSLVVARWLLSCSTWAPQLQQAGSLVAAPGLLSCGLPAPQLWHEKSQLQHACGIQFPDQGSNPTPCIGSVESYPLPHQGCPITSFASCEHCIIYVFKYDINYIIYI